ncbi:MAG TPA: aminoacyl-tRNA hydrolase [Chitinophagaceae bacterium]|nr:aminoacyl-tRNA hydrolase [Chitinophagaceae bacterium]
MKYLIAGLGNIGAEYHETRHNIGFDVVEVFVRKQGASFRNERLAEVAEVKFKGRTLILIKPTTYMNLSGKAVKYWLDREKIPVQQSLTIVDDLAFPLDVLKLKGSGSSAGHNGLKSMEECLGTQQYARLRFGIGNEYPKGRQADFVLGKWKDEEIPLVNLKVEASCTIIEQFCTIGLERTMNWCNQLKFSV